MTDYTHMRRAPILDGRLSAAMALAGQPKLFADIGADHGRLSVVMLLADPKRRALVADVSAAALSKAQARISWMGLTDRAVFAVADGLDALDSLFGWDATAEAAEDWMYQSFAEKFLFDEQTRQWMEEVNKWAVHSASERLLEANQRGMWNTDPETLNRLRSIYMRSEGTIEEASL